MRLRATIGLCAGAALVAGGAVALLSGRQARTAAREARALHSEISVLLEARDEQIRQVADIKAELDRTAAAWKKAEADLEAAKRANIDLGQKLAGYAEELARRQAEEARLAQTRQRLEEGLQRELADRRVSVSRIGNCLSVNLAGNALFESGQTTLSPEGMEVLRRVGEVVREAEGRSIRVVGHTDDRPVSAARRGVFASNWELSALRATTVVRFLVDSVGVEPERCEAVGVAEFHPVADNETPEGRALNRRIEIVLAPLPPSSETGAAPAPAVPAVPRPAALSSPGGGTPSGPPAP